MNIKRITYSCRGRDIKAAKARVGWRALVEFKNDRFIYLLNTRYGWIVL